MATGAKFFLNTAITTSAGAYTAGDSVGGKILQYPGQRVNTALVQDIKVVDAANQKQPFTVFLFNADPTASTITDNAAFVLHASDRAKVVGIIGVLAADYVTFNSQAFVDGACQVDINWFDPRTDSSPPIPTLWMAIVTSGTPTYAGNSTTLYVTLGCGETTP